MTACAMAGTPPSQRQPHKKTLAQDHFPNRGMVSSRTFAPSYSHSWDPTPTAAWLTDHSETPDPSNTTVAWPTDHSGKPDPTHTTAAWLTDHSETPDPSNTTVAWPTDHSGKPDPTHTTLEYDPRSIPGRQTQPQTQKKPPPTRLRRRQFKSRPTHHARHQRYQCHFRY